MSKFRLIDKLSSCLNFKSKLSRKVLLAVFISILVVEAIILIPSYKNYEKDELLRLEQANLYALKTTLYDYSNKLTELKPGELKKILSHTDITGIKIYSEGKEILAFGEIPLNPENKLSRLEHWYNSFRDEDGNRYEILWDNKDLASDKYIVKARLDSSEINSKLLSFVLRILGLVLIIATFVTITAMISLRSIILNPLLTLRSKLLDAGKHPENLSAINLPKNRHDEMTDIYSNFNTMINRISEGLLEIKKVNKDLEMANTNLEDKVKKRTEEIANTNTKLLSEIEERKKYEDKLVQLTNYDVNTGLANKNSFMGRLKDLITDLDSEDLSIAAFVIDLNNYNQIVDAYNPNIANLFITKIVERISSYVSGINLAARIENNQIAVVLDPYSNIDICTVAIDNLIKAFSEPVEIGQHKIITTINMGVSIYPNDATDPNILYSNAITALNRAKELHKNNYQYYKTEMNKNIKVRQDILTDLYKALENKEFYLVFQPKVNLKLKKVIGAEALIRWQHPTKGEINPDDFISVAEESGLIINIGKWVIEEVVRQIYEWNLNDLTDFQISLNLSPVQFRQPDLTRFIKNVIDTYSINKGLLELEITESTIAENIESAKFTLENLSNLGVKISIDDFGTGYSSMGYLKHLPVDIIKIDKSFIETILESENDKKIVQAIVGLGHTLDLKVVAEGVETKQQEEIVSQLDCDYSQGFYYSKPLKLENFIEFIKKYKIA